MKLGVNVLNYFSLLFVAIGIYALIGAICDWEWFMNSRKARTMVSLLGRDGTRVLYSILGVLLIVLGVLGSLGIVDMNSTR